ncbi:hypothetical protein LK08_10655 [Streptomyces sp. MUSC 125]|nr:hypothetical protein LK08_10655 [Streptomyces sp. MUSC 125]
MRLLRVGRAGAPGTGTEHPALLVGPTVRAASGRTGALETPIVDPRVQFGSKPMTPAGAPPGRTGRRTPRTPYGWKSPCAAVTAA